MRLPVKGQVCDACGEPATISIGGRTCIMIFDKTPTYLCEAHWQAPMPGVKQLILHRRTQPKIPSNRFVLIFEELE